MNPCFLFVIQFKDSNTSFFITIAFLFADSSSEEARVEFLKYPNPIIVREGSDASFCVRFRCNTEHKPSITWTVGGKHVEPSERYIVSNESLVMKFVINHTLTCLQ